MAALQWNAEADVLAVLLRPSATANGVDRPHRLQLWYRENYHWYLKRQWLFPAQQAPAALAWDPEAAHCLHIATADCTCLRLAMCWDVSASGGPQCTVAVIDGGACAAAATALEAALTHMPHVHAGALQVTPLSLAMVPPPMSAHAIPLPIPAQEVAFAPAHLAPPLGEAQAHATDAAAAGSDHALCVLLADGSVRFYARQGFTVFEQPAAAGWQAPTAEQQAAAAAVAVAVAHSDTSEAAPARDAPRDSIEYLGARPRGKGGDERLVHREGSSSGGGGGKSGVGAVNPVPRQAAARGELNPFAPWSLQGELTQWPRDVPSALVRQLVWVRPHVLVALLSGNERGTDAVVELAVGLAPEAVGDDGGAPAPLRGAPALRACKRAPAAPHPAVRVQVVNCSILHLPAPALRLVRWNDTVSLAASSTATDCDAAVELADGQVLRYRCAGRAGACLAWCPGAAVLMRDDPPQARSCSTMSHCLRPAPGSPWRTRMADRFACTFASRVRNWVPSMPHGTSPPCRSTSGACWWALQVPASPRTWTAWPRWAWARASSMWQRQARGSSLQTRPSPCPSCWG